MQPGSITSRWLSATQIVAVDDDVRDLTLQGRIGASVNGRIVRDVFATRSLDPAGVMISFEHRLAYGRIGLSWGGVTARGAYGAMRIGSDGDFSIESPGGTSVIRRVEIVLTDRVSEVRGSVVERTGRRVAGGSVIVFVDNSALWGESSRHVRETRSARDGGFEFAGLPPGDYLAVAVEDLPALAWMNPDVLNRLRPQATRFRLDEGEERVVILRPSPAPDGLIP